MSRVNRPAGHSTQAARFSVRVLDPVAKCGKGTSVRQLYRVEEIRGGQRHPHLVFFDRHGWYCQHGPNCAAVAHARRFAQSAHAREGHHSPR